MTTFAVAGAPTTWPVELGDYLSASRLNKFATCPEQFRRYYLQGEREPSNPNLVWGSADSYAAAVNYTQKIASHEDLPLEDVKQAFATGFDEAAESEEVNWGDAHRGDVLDQGINLAAAYHTQIAPHVQPLTVEERVEVTVPGVPVPVIGYVDLTAAGVTIERKTSGRKAVVIQPQWRIQGLVYLLAREQPVHWHVGVKNKTPAVYSALTEPGLVLDVKPVVAARVIASITDQLVGMFERYGPDDSWPGNITHQWACGLCSFQPTCPWWS